MEIGNFLSATLEIFISALVFDTSILVSDTSALVFNRSSFWPNLIIKQGL